MGTNSLLGYVSDARIPPGPIIISFEETSLEWRRNHGGAEEIIVPEFFPAALCGDLLFLVRSGYSITIAAHQSSPVNQK